MADGIDLLERFDGLAPLRNALRRVAREREEWAGIPMPLDTHELVVEPSYPNAVALMVAGKIVPEENDGSTVRGRFWSVKISSEVVIYEREGKVGWGVILGLHHLKHDLHTLGASDAWGVEQESNALQLLATLIGHRHFKQYLLTGMFLETSKRSGVTYLFRRLKPTVAIVPGKSGKSMRILCALCLHPIAYYAESWAGAMCPTDDVVAHLMLMRGDEPMFWRRANQHPAYRPEAGL